MIEWEIDELPPVTHRFRGTQSFNFTTINRRPSLYKKVIHRVVTEL